MDRCPRRRSREIVATDGTRLHCLAAAPVGQLVVDYTATVAPGASERPVSPLEAIGFHSAQPLLRFGSPRRRDRHPLRRPGGAELVAAVTDWVTPRSPGHSRKQLRSPTVPSRPTSPARAYAVTWPQLVVTFLRAGGMPARLVVCARPESDGLPRRGRGRTGRDVARIDATRLAAARRWCTPPPAATRPTRPSSPSTPVVPTWRVGRRRRPGPAVEDTAAVVSLSQVRGAGEVSPGIATRHPQDVGAPDCQGRADGGIGK